MKILWCIQSWNFNDSSAGEACAICRFYNEPVRIWPDIDPWSLILPDIDPSFPWADRICLGGRWNMWTENNSRAADIFSVHIIIFPLLKVHTISYPNLQGHRNNHFCERKIWRENPSGSTNTCMFSIFISQIENTC